MLTHCPGQSSIAEACPVCAHSPISPDDCKPNRNLRNTVKAFIKSEEKKRAKEKENTAATTPAVPVAVTPAVESPVNAPKQLVENVEVDEHTEPAGIANEEVDTTVNETSANENTETTAEAENVRSPSSFSLYSC